nr:Ig-like domain-containing protein [Staphylococcus epidermidis]
MWPTSNEQFNLKANYELDDSIKEGDTFTIKYGYIRFNCNKNSTT